MLLGLAGTAPTPALAQGPPANPPQIDVERLGINLARIRRELQESFSEHEERDGLNLRYQIEVFGRLPEIKLFTAEDNLTNGPVPYGAPSHREMIDHITPPEFRSPVMDFNGLLKWLAEKAK